MKTIFINNPAQDENTKDIQLIDGVFYHWNTRAIKLRGTLKDKIAELSNRVKDRKVKYLLLYDVISTTRYFCDQGCKPGEGCKKNYKENDHAIIILADMIHEK